LEFDRAAHAAGGWISLRNRRTVSSRAKSRFDVQLVPLAARSRVFGFNQQVMGAL